MKDEIPPAGLVATVPMPRLYVETAWGPQRNLITFDSLKKVVETVPYHGGGAAVRAFVLAISFLEELFGKGWTEKYARTTEGSDFLRNSPRDLRSLNEHVTRIIFLGETIFNLQRVSGLENCLSQLRAGHIESAYAELETGKVLSIYGVAFRYVKPQRKLGADYDIELFHPNGALCCADTKCKFETTNLTVGTIVDSFNTARAQMPKDKPGVVIVKAPQGWMENGEFADKLKQATLRFFRSTERVISIYAFSPILISEELWVVDNIAGIEWVNAKHRFDPSLDWRLFHLYAGQMPTPHWWVRFTTLFSSEFTVYWRQRYTYGPQAG